MSTLVQCGAQSVYFKPIIGLNHYWQKKRLWRNSNFTASLFLRFIIVLCVPVYKGVWIKRTQNCQTSNTSASQNNNLRPHQKTFRMFEQARKFLGAANFPNENTWYWRHTKSQLPTEWEHRFTRSQTASARLGFRGWNLCAASI